jgi:hypothetical protein
MFQQENPEGDNAGQLVQFAQDESPAQMDRQERAPLPMSFCVKADRSRSGKM